jgi:peptidoglycan hydrolase CwlO-like protein
VQRVQLGCGTLILIALIVLLFSNSGSHSSNAVSNLQTEVHDLRSDVSSLKSDVLLLQRTIESQTEQIKFLRTQLDKSTTK